MRRINTIEHTDFERLYQTMRTELLAYYRTHLPNPEDAEDFVQRAYANVLGEDVTETAEGLLRRAASNLLKNAYRDHERRGEVCSFEALIGDDAEGLDHLPEFQYSDFEDTEFAADLDHTIRGLDEPIRDAFILGELRGLTSREAAEVLGVSHITAQARRREATSIVREEIAA